MTYGKFDQLLLYNYLMRDNKTTKSMEEQDMYDKELVNSAKAALNEMYGTGAYPKITFELSEDDKKRFADVVGKRLEEKKAEEKWVWVTGYKGLDKDMKAHGGFQYEMDQLYIMPDGERVQACYSGFHLCLNLKDLYKYKFVEAGNRFFECKALVRESDLNEYGKAGFLFKKDKLAAKSIRLVRELSVDEILADVDGATEWTQDVKEMAITDGIYKAKTEWKIIVMTRMGYARSLAEYIVNHCDGSGYDLAVALDAQTDISMDTKVNAIFSHI